MMNKDKCPSCGSLRFMGMLWMGKHLGRYCHDCGEVWDRKGSEQEIDSYLSYIKK